MRKALFVVMSTLAVTASLGSISAAAGRERFRHIAPPPIQDHYCLQGRIWGYPGNCQFATYEQCMASASGTDAYCGENPAHQFGPQRRPAY